MTAGYLSAKLKNSQSSPVNRIPRKKHPKMNDAACMPIHTHTHTPAEACVSALKQGRARENV